MLRRIRKTKTVVALILSLCMVMTLVIGIRFSNNSAETTKLSKPTNVKVEDVDPFTATVSWDAVNGASGYIVRYTYSGCSDVFTQNTGRKTSYKFKNLNPNKVYKFSVKAYKGNGAKRIYSLLSTNISYQPLPIETPVFSLANTSADENYSITLNLTPMNYMSQFLIYRSVDNENFENVATIGASSTDWIDANVEPGNTYYYKVRSYNGAKKCLMYSDDSEVESLTIDEPVLIEENTEEVTENITDETPVENTNEIPETTEAPAESAPEALNNDNPVAEETTTEETVAEDTTEAPADETPVEDTTEAPKTETPEVVNTVATPEKTDDEIAYEILEYVNAERAKYGYQQLVMDDKIKALSDIRAKEISEKYSHTRPDGRKWSTTYNDAGIKMYGIRAENLAWGYQDAEGFYNAWYNSSGHYANFILVQAKYVGISIYTDPETGYKYAAYEVCAYYDNNTFWQNEYMSSQY